MLERCAEKRIFLQTWWECKLIYPLWRTEIPLKTRTKTTILPSNPTTGHIPSEKMKVTQLCLTLCDPMDYTVHRILQARILECVAFPFFRGSSLPRNRIQLSLIEGGFFTS